MYSAIKYAFLLLVVLIPCIGAAQTDDKAVIDRIVATIGGEVILLSEIEEQFSYAKQQQGATLPADFKCVSLQNIIMQKLLVNQAKLDSVELKDEEVETQLDVRIERLLSYFNQDQKALEEYYGQSIDQIKEQNRTDLKNQILAQKMQGTITEKASITPNEVQRFFSEIPKDSLPYFNAEVEIREVVLKPKVNSIEREKARQRIDELRTRIVGGEDFATLAKKYSEDSGSGAQGGDLGFQKRGALVSEFEAMAYKLEPKQVSPLVETVFGFHIIELLERRGNLIHCRHILIKPEITQADLDLTKFKLDSVRNQILDSTLTFSEAIKKVGDKNQQSFSNDGRVSNPKSGNTYFEVADLDTDIYFAIEGLKVNEISKPFEFRAPDGTLYYRIVQLVSRSKPHKADLRQDYNKIQQAALDQKRSDIMETWALQRLRATYLGIHSSYSECPNLQQMITIQK